MSATPNNDRLEKAARWLGRQTHDLDAVARRVIGRQAVVDDPNRRLADQSTFGERLADKVASFGGSWKFILLFAGALVIWVLLNSEILGKTAFDPYPYIFLNLMLSMLAAIQAPVIMMSQNRQAMKDRLMASYDYEVNLKAELEIMSLHEKVDVVSHDTLLQILQQQQRQIDLLTELVARGGAAPDAR
ncbi:DUF1003 domain-containing protein [Bacillus subtilis subsp. subtilis]|nr:DUF1003 domain-containing protein [Bacillus subtilis subsp. subtilis]